LRSKGRTVATLLIQPHRNRGGIWRVKLGYETSEPLSMSAVQASSI
jgi:hypothetical protein